MKAVVPGGFDRNKYTKKLKEIKTENTKTLLFNLKRLDEVYDEDEKSLLCMLEKLLTYKDAQDVL